METNMNNRLYILIRNDIPSMNPGRAMAQASHAANAFIHKYGKQKDVKQWQRQTCQGFGTAIVLAADIVQIREIFIGLSAHKIKEEIIDPDYAISVSSEIIPYIAIEKIGMFNPSTPGRYSFHREEITCAYIFGDSEILKPFLEDLPLHP